MILEVAGVAPLPEARVPPRVAGWVAVVIALAVLALHMAVSTRYGYFRDELYYIAASRHPALGYFDFPLGVAAVAWLVGHTFGYALWALHLPPALAHAGLVLIAGGIAADLGAGTVGVLLAALATAVAPAYLGSASILTMDVFDELCWALAGWAALRALQRDRPRVWLWFGAAAALGLLFKMTMLLFGAAVLAGLLLSATGRRHLRTPWPWLGGAIAALGALPYFLWEVGHGWPTLAFYSMYRVARATSGQSPLAFLGAQVLIASVLSAPIWVAGLSFTLVAPAGRGVRALGWACVVLFVALGVARAKVYFVDPVYTVLFGVGAPRVEAWILRPRRRWMRVAYPVAVVLAAAVLAPALMPLLPPAAAVAYARAPLAQPLADRFGWPQQVSTVAGVYGSLAPAERAKACILASNYGEAGAIDFFGPAYGLPAAISGHNQYYLWGPHGCDFGLVISVGLSRSDLAPLFGSVRQAATTHCQYCMPYENDAPVDIDTQPKLSPAAIWRQLRSVS